MVVRASGLHGGLSVKGERTLDLTRVLLVSLQVWLLVVASVLLVEHLIKTKKMEPYLNYNNSLL